MIIQGIRDGVSTNQIDMQKLIINIWVLKFNETEPSKYIQCLDSNNLYGWAMSNHCPHMFLNG